MTHWWWWPGPSLRLTSASPRSGRPVSTSWHSEAAAPSYGAGTRLSLHIRILQSNLKWMLVTHTHPPPELACPHQCDEVSQGCRDWHQGSLPLPPWRDILPCQTQISSSAGGTMGWENLCQAGPILHKVWADTFSFPQVFYFSLRGNDYLPCLLFVSLVCWLMMFRCWCFDQIIFVADNFCTVWLSSKDDIRDD